MIQLPERFHLPVPVSLLISTGASQATIRLSGAITPKKGADRPVRLSPAWASSSSGFRVDPIPGLAALAAPPEPAGQFPTGAGPPGIVAAAVHHRGVPPTFTGISGDG